MIRKIPYANQNPPRPGAFMQNEDAENAVSRKIARLTSAAIIARRA